MSIVDQITKACKQTAVYWGTPADDGRGGRTYASPVEISCRWEKRVAKVTPPGGLIEEVESHAQVIVLQDLDERGYLYLGELDDLDSADQDFPEVIDDAYEIKWFVKIPALGSTTQFHRKAYL